MAVSDETLRLARKLNRPAAEAVLSEHYTAVWRMAHGIVGKAEAARDVVEAVFRLSLRVMPTWRPGLTPAAWFQHHTLLNSRRVAEPPAAAKEDLLVLAGEESAEYLAFIGALRRLPIQQREAFILNHGEKLQERQLGVAMDSSTTAAANHLRAATEALNAVTENRLPELAAKMAEAYAKLAPTEKAVVQYVRREVNRAVWRRRVTRAIRRIITLGVLAGLAYVGWLHREQLIEQYHQIRQMWGGS